MVIGKQGYGNNNNNETVVTDNGSAPPGRTDQTRHSDSDKPSHGHSPHPPDTKYI